jgi:hypothetical protein
MGKFLQSLGLAVGIASAAALAGVFLFVLANGSWPNFLMPIGELLAGLRRFFGKDTLLILFGIFVVPGSFIYWIGSSMERGRVRKKRKSG